nr:Histone deacetylase superfamily domain containing protein [Haemonchus contortus]
MVLHQGTYANQAWHTKKKRRFASIEYANAAHVEVNIPWSHANIGDDAYRAAFAKVIMPIAYEFNPEIVFISSGFDAAIGDPLGEYRVNAETFALMAYQLLGLAGGRVIAVLEGGYNLAATAECAAAVCQVMVDGSVRNITKSSDATNYDSPARLPRRVWDSIRGVASSQEPYWNCLKGFQDPR